MTMTGSADPQNSPLFPAHFCHDAKELTSSGSISVGIALAEKNLFVHGFDGHEQELQPPALLRGSLVVKVSKSTKIKAINLAFRGIARTEWPEGIPPRKIDTFEQKDLTSHVWPFFNSSFPMAEYTSGAHIVRSSHIHDSQIMVEEEMHDEDDHGYIDHEIHIIKGLANKLRRAASPSRNRSRSPSLSTTAETATIRRKDSADSSLTTNNVVCTASPKDEPIEKDVHTKGYRLFPPGEYIYNFELPIQASLPETISAAFGSVTYMLEASIERPGAFRSKLVGKKEVRLVRAPADQSQEVTEPIVISRQWEDQLHYDIVIGAKSIPIGTAMQVAFKLTPLAKVKCHRIRIYISENIDYYCRKMKIHRVEPARKYLVFERKAAQGSNDSLLANLEGVQELMAGGATEFEFDVVIPEKVGKDKKERLHANTSYKNIKVHHWIKVVLRLSKIDPEKPDKRKHFEISIDSPFHLLDSRCTGANVSLPVYLARSEVPPRPIHLIRQPSVAPPPFDADEAPPQLAEPPSYDMAADRGTYQERFSEYQQSRGRQPSLTPSTAPSMDLSTVNPRDSSAALLRRASETSINVLATTPPAFSHISARNPSVTSTSSSSVDITVQGRANRRGENMFTQGYSINGKAEGVTSDDEEDPLDTGFPSSSSSADGPAPEVVTAVDSNSNSENSDAASSLTAMLSTSSVGSSFYNRRLDTDSICSDRLLDDDGLADNIHGLDETTSRLDLNQL